MDREEEEVVPLPPVSRQGLTMLRIDQTGQSPRIALLAHVPIGPRSSASAHNS